MFVSCDYYNVDLASSSLSPRYSLVVDRDILLDTYVPNIYSVHVDSDVIACVAIHDRISLDGYVNKSRALNA
jgi:hypothetical protein